MSTFLECWRDEGKHLHLDIDEEYPDRNADRKHVCRALSDHFQVTWGARSPFDITGENHYLEFVWKGETFLLHWNHWVGLSIVAVHAGGEPLLPEFATYFAANPIPFEEDTKGQSGSS